MEGSMTVQCMRDMMPGEQNTLLAEQRLDKLFACSPLIVAFNVLQ